jgi:hypothetical protein
MQALKNVSACGLVRPERWLMAAKKTGNLTISGR